MKIKVLETGDGIDKAVIDKDVYCYRLYMISCQCRHVLEIDGKKHELTGFEQVQQDGDVVTVRCVRAFRLH